MGSEVRPLTKHGNPDIVTNWPVTQEQYETLKLADEFEGAPVVAKREVQGGYRVDCCKSASDANCLECNKRNGCPVFERMQHT